MCSPHAPHHQWIYGVNNRLETVVDPSQINANSRTTDRYLIYLWLHKFTVYLLTDALKADKLLAL